MPVGGAANGMPLKTNSPPWSSPSSLPERVDTVAVISVNLGGLVARDSCSIHTQFTNCDGNGIRSKSRCNDSAMKGMANNRPLKFGILGAARIAPEALIKPAQKSSEAEVVAIAAREPARAREFADAHHIPRVHATYADLIADPELDVIYNPLPNSLHCEWTIAALRAGKHVLCEKPIASNPAEAAKMPQPTETTSLIPS